MCPSRVVSVGLTGLPSPFCFHTPISIVESLQNVCPETSLMLGREGRDRAKLERVPRSPEGRMWVLWNRLFSMGRVLRELGCCWCWQDLLGE